jgi:hypothetical protein
MTPDEIIQELERYSAELTGIMGRFVHSSGSYDIRDEDDPRYRTFIIEIIDLLNDTIGRNQYSPLINQMFNEGISGYFHRPSYKSIEDIVSVINSVITRLKRNPDFYIKKEEPIKPSEPEKTELQPPEKVTLKWIWEHVPYRYWLAFFGLLISAFLIGASIGETKLYKMITDLTTSTPNVSKKIPTVK